MSNEYDLQGNRPIYHEGWHSVGRGGRLLREGALTILPINKTKSPKLFLAQQVKILNDKFVILNSS